jgi:ketosteroid isomerase-like protein
MNINKGFSITVVFIFFTFFLSAQNKVEKTITNQIEMLRLAMVNADEAALNELVCEKLSYGHSAGYVEDKKEFIRKLTSGENDFVKIDLSNQTISISANVAVVRHRLDASTLDIGKPPAQIKLLILMVWQKDHGTWKLLARQAVKITS